MLSAQHLFSQEVGDLHIFWEAVSQIKPCFSATIETPRATSVDERLCLLSTPVSPKTKVWKRRAMLLPAQQQQPPSWTIYPLSSARRSASGDSSAPPPPFLVPRAQTLPSSPPDLFVPEQCTLSMPSSCNPPPQGSQHMRTQAWDHPRPRKRGFSLPCQNGLPSA